MTFPHFSRPQRTTAGWMAVVALAVGLTGCAAPSSNIAPAWNSFAAHDHWSGRMGLQILQADGHNSAQSFSASFELRGTPVQGQLDVFNPLGSQVAQLSWQPGMAWLRQGETVTPSDSLPSLVRRSLGTEVPIAAMFAWLQGQPAAADGWTVDLQQYPQGRITARRTHPEPQAQLRLVLQPTP